jgi:hypothetical protein
MEREIRSWPHIVVIDIPPSSHLEMAPMGYTQGPEKKIESRY